LVALQGAAREPISAKEMSAPHLTAITASSTRNNVKQVSCEKGVPFDVKLVQAAINAGLGLNHATKSMLQGGPNALTAIQLNTQILKGVHPGQGFACSSPGCPWPGPFTGKHNHLTFGGIDNEPMLVAVGAKAVNNALQLLGGAA
jgi:hypothetical protein